MASEVFGWSSEVEAHLVARRSAPAEALCLARLEAAPGDPLALSMLSFVRVEQQRWDEAETLLEGACALHPGSASLHATLASLYLMRGKPAEALGPQQRCVVLDRSAATGHEHRAKLAALYQGRRFTEWSAEAKDAVLACLADDAVTHALMSRAWLSLLRLDPASAELLALFASEDYESFRARVTPEVLSSGWQGNDLLVRGLERFVVADLELERGVTFTRRWFHELAASGEPARLAPFLPLLVNLARYAFLTEYVLDGGEPAFALRDAAGAAPAVAALLGSYEPLHAHPEAARLATLSSEPCYRELVRVQVHEPLKERKIAARIPLLAPITDVTSRAVRAQYEENPYPRWIGVGHVAVPGVVAAEARGKNILVAGCGTGREAIETALIFPAARVDALDLSRTSLAYGIRKARELAVTNLFFLQGDLLELRHLRKPFDLIVSSGVLHHLEQPRAGLAACLDVLRPGGVLKLALYSRLARTEITEARRWVSAQRERFSPELAGIRAFRGAVKALPIEDAMRARLIAWDDFYATSACRDLVFHVREHTFTLPELADLASACALSVVRVETRNPAHHATYRERFPDDPQATDLLNWHLLEQEIPTMFAGMYVLWLCRADEVHDLELDWVAHTGRM